MNWTVRGLFDRASELSPELLEGCLLEAKANGCPDSVLAEVRSLIANVSKGNTRSDVDLDPIRASAERIVLLGALTRIGPYRIDRVLARGGFGVVYLAEQEQPVRRSVAVKVLDPGRATPAAMRHFELEREVLGQLQHPNIASILDAGKTEWGQAYIVMELVAVRRDQDVRPADPITAYCDQRRLSIRDRLDLFRQVCHAVQHAHARGIIHRDLKPSNILVAEVEGKPVPKIIDFGIAKLTQIGPGAALVDVTHEGQAIGSLAYMSPEQAAGDKGVSVQSDVYSLGVVLYELLSGLLPLERRGRSTQQLLATIISGESPAAARRLDECAGHADDGMVAHDIAAARSLGLRELRGILRSELEWIPEKAMRVDVDARYATVVELSEDVRRYLAGEPLLAGPESVMYRARKVLRRHRVATTAVGAVFVALLVGIAVAVHGLREANVARAAAEHSRRDALLKSVENAEHRGNWPALIKTVEEAVNLPGTDRTNLLLRRLAAYDALDQKTAALQDLEYLQGLPDLGIDRASVLLWKGDLQLLGMDPSDDPTRAVESIHAALDLARRDSSQRLSLPDRLYAQGLVAPDLKAAHEKFRAALRVDPFHPRAGRMMLITSVMTAHFQEAIDIAVLQETLSPDNPEPVAWRVFALEALGRSDEATSLMGGLAGRVDEAALTTMQDLRTALRELKALELDVTRLGGDTFFALLAKVQRIREQSARVIAQSGSGARPMPYLSHSAPALFGVLTTALQPGVTLNEADLGALERGMGPAGECVSLLLRAGNAMQARRFAEVDALLDRVASAPPLINVRPSIVTLRFLSAASRWQDEPSEENSERLIHATRMAIRDTVPAEMSWTTYARTAARLGDQDLARYAWSTLIHAFPKNMALRAELAKLELSLDNPIRAMQLCDEVLNKQPRAAPTFKPLRETAAERVRHLAQALPAAGDEAP